ncbi:hypothetical protein RDV64_06500 [Acuticoccus sp. MNP-M23]|uniref:hypothetical protein n=1 Tax=Acuticoccus sp. MNP-M23 TaxID=3072793 RepID=UPI0028154A72|nr:hypothetical protein [Acuticoccus sp. MNP-M23]WMS44035.1 hypothetical protein RDV64_06500 [Acuticoccus sp. MNP-M23]
MNDVTAAAQSTSPVGSLFGLIKAMFGKGPVHLPVERPDAPGHEGEFADEGYFSEYPFRCHGIYGGFGHY